MKLNALKHKLDHFGEATVDSITFTVNKETEKFIKKEEKAGRLEVTPSEVEDHYLELKVIKKKDADKD